MQLLFLFIKTPILLYKNKNVHYVDIKLVFFKSSYNNEGDNNDRRKDVKTFSNLISILLFYQHSSLFIRVGLIIPKTIQFLIIGLGLGF